MTSDQFVLGLCVIGGLLGGIWSLLLSILSELRKGR